MDMRKWLALILVVFMANVQHVLFAQENEVRKTGSFRAVSASQDIDVYLKKGDKESVKVEVNGIALSKVLTDVSGTTLKIHLSSGSHSGKITIKVYVVYVNLEKITANSAANIFSDGPVKSASLELSAYSAGSVEVTLESTSVNVETSSAGDVVLEGKTTNLSAESSSAGDIDAYKLDAENVTASASSAGEIKVNVMKALTATANSGGRIRYRGNPSKTMINANSGGSVKKSN
jgi:Putative auto-transporter adhesin, head GIN domain